MKPKFIKQVVALVLLIALFYLVDPRDIAHAFSSLSAAWIVILMAISFIMIYVSALKWKVLLGSKADSVCIWHLVRLYFIGYFINCFFPSFVAGDALRSNYLGKTIGQSDAAIATILERSTGLLMMIILGGISVWLMPEIDPNLKLFVTVVTLLFIIASVSLFSSKVVSYLPNLPYRQKFLNARERSIAILRDPRSSLEVFVLSAMFHLLAVINTWACCLALGWSSVSIGELCFVVPVVLLISAFPITPSGLGVQEGAFLFFLKKLGATSEIALGVGLLLRAKIYVLALMGGVFWYFERNKALIKTSKLTEHSTLPAQNEREPSSN